MPWYGVSSMYIGSSDSESWGRWLGRFSTMRLIWEQAITAAFSSPAMTFREREISVISFTRLTGPPAVLALHQLQVVDHDQVHTPVQVQRPGLAADLDHALVRGVVDVYRQLRELPDGVDHELLLGLGVQPQADPVGVDAGLGGQGPHGELVRGHLQAEDGAGVAGLGVVHGHVQAQGALAHRRPGGQDHQVGALEPAQDLVQVRESRHDRSGRPRQEVVHGRLLFLQVAVEDVPEGLEVALLGGVPDRVERVLGLPERECPGRRCRHSPV